MSNRGVTCLRRSWLGYDCRSIHMTSPGYYFLVEEPDRNRNLQISIVYLTYRRTESFQISITGNLQTNTVYRTYRTTAECFFQISIKFLHLCISPIFRFSQIVSVAPGAGNTSRLRGDGSHMTCPATEADLTDLKTTRALGNTEFLLCISCSSCSFAPCAMYTHFPLVAVVWTQLPQWQTELIRPWLRRPVIKISHG